MRWVQTFDSRFVWGGVGVLLCGYRQVFYEVQVALCGDGQVFYEVLTDRWK